MAISDDDIELEETIHDIDKIKSISVLEAEMEVMKGFIKKSNGHEKEFFSDKLGNIEFQKSTIENNCQIGIITVDSYLQDMKDYLKAEKGLLGTLQSKMGKTNKHVLRIMKRIELVEKEIQEMEAGDEEEEEEEEEAKQPAS